MTEPAPREHLIAQLRTLEHRCQELRQLFGLTTRSRKRRFARRRGVRARCNPVLLEEYAEATRRVERLHAQLRALRAVEAELC